MYIFVNHQSLGSLEGLNLDEKIWQGLAVSVLYDETLINCDKMSLPT
jgi:hypothetical protein